MAGLLFRKNHMSLKSNSEKEVQYLKSMTNWGGKLSENQ